MQINKLENFGFYLLDDSISINIISFDKYKKIDKKIG